MLLEKIGKPAMLEQLAEECSELTQAALKKARILRRENPSPVTEEMANANLEEETADILLCINELISAAEIHMASVEKIMTAKRKRMNARLEENINQRHEK